MLIDPFVLAYAILYLMAFGLAYRNRKTFPFSESLLVILIVGFGFTGLTYLATLPVKSRLITVSVSTPELALTLAYLVVVAVLLVFRATPKSWKGDFRKEKLAALLFKLPVFVILPLLALRLFRGADWASLGFSAGDVPGQLLAAAILMVCFGGFNLIAGSGAAPLRARKFSGRQVTLGLLVTFGWNIVEVGLVEEFFFRAFLQTRLVNFLGAPLAGICLTALLFGLARLKRLFRRRGAGEAAPEKMP
mgnify:CR=1 FL=1